MFVMNVALVSIILEALNVFVILVILETEAYVKVIAILLKKLCFLHFCEYRIGHSFMYNFLQMSWMYVEISYSVE